MLERIYFETNSLRGRWPAKVTAELETILRLAALVGVRVCIPNSAVIELEEHIIRSASDDLRAAREKMSAANLVLNGLALFEAPNLTDKTVRAAYHAAVQQSVAGHGIEVVSTTTTSLEDFVRFATRRWAPFKQEDRGFRDAVHLRSIIEHLQGDPVPPGGEAILITSDGRLGQTDVTEMVKRANVPLSIRETHQTVVQELQQHPRLQADTRQKIDDLLKTWSPLVLKAVQNHLLAALRAGAIDAYIGRGVRVDLVFAAEAAREPGSESVTPPAMDRPNDYRYSLEIRLSIDGVGSRQTEIAAGSRVDLLRLDVVFLISIEATVSCNDRYEINALKFESARLFAVFWSRQDVENLAAPVELLRGATTFGTKEVYGSG